MITGTSLGLPASTELGQSWERRQWGALLSAAGCPSVGLDSRAAGRGLSADFRCRDRFQMVEVTRSLTSDKWSTIKLKSQGTHREEVIRV